MPLDDTRHEFRLLAPMSPGVRYQNAPTTERILQNQLPARADPCSYAGSTGALAADAEFAERSYGDSAAERRARDAERQRQKRAAARA